MLFRNRTDAGERLADACRVRIDRLKAGGRPIVVLGIPRGGIPVAAPVATALQAPLDAIVVRKLGVPGNDEVAMGAIGEGVTVLDRGLIRSLRVADADVDAAEVRERRELARRMSRFRDGRPPLAVAGAVAVIVDDGIATGSTARAACAVARSLGAASIVLAVPVAPPDWEPQSGGDVDEFVCLERPTHFFAVGQWYDDFTQTTDDQVRDLLGLA